MLMAATICAAFSDLAMAKKDPAPLVHPDDHTGQDSDPDAARTINSDTPLDVTDKRGTDSDKSKPKKEPVKKEVEKEPVNKTTQSWLKRALKFGADNTFRVVQLSDILIDGDEQNFVNTQHFIENLLKKENPDLIVITGDTVHPLGDYEYEGRWISAMEYIKSTNIPYVSTGGSLMEKMGRYDALQIDKNFGGEQSWSGFKWNE